MRFTLATIAALVGATSAAPAAQTSGGPPDPNTYENIDISDFSLRKTLEGDVTSVSFSLSGDDADNLLCQAENPAIPSEVITCGDSKYRFALDKAEDSNWSLTLYHELGTAVGFWGQGELFAYCHAGGLGDLLCTQQDAVTIVIDNGSH